MRRIVGIIGTGLFVAALLAMAPAAQALQYGDLTYTSNGTSITITGCSDSATDVVIPATIDGLPVTAIYYEAFLHHISLVNLAIPASVTYIDNLALYGCTRLANIDVDGANPSFVSLDGVLFSKDQSLLIQYPVAKTAHNYTIPDGVTSIGMGAFLSSSLTNVSIPDGVTEIGAWAFYGSSLNSVEIPNSVTDIGHTAFYACASLASVVFGYGVTTIGEHAFAYCTSLASVYFEGNAPILSSDVFVGGSNATVYYLPDTSGWESTYGGLPAIPWLDIEYGDLTCRSYGTSIAVRACSTSATNVVVPATIDGLPVTAIGINAFAYCTSLTSIEIPDNVTSIGGSALYNCTSLTNITIPDGVTSIAEAAFYDCTSLSKVEIGDNVTSIGKGAFYNCTSLTSIEIPDSVSTIGDYAFYNCTSLASVEVGDSVTSIGGAAFMNCTSLTSIEIPDGVTYIWDYTLGYCTTLASISIPASVTAIGRRAFRDCTDLASLYFAGNAPSLSSDVFSGVDNVTVYYRPGTSGWGTTFGGRPAMLWNPTIDIGEDFGVGENGFGFSIAGTTNIPIVIEACTNLEEGVWIPLQSNTLSNGTLQFNDPEWENHPNRVYRITGP